VQAEYLFQDDPNFHEPGECFTPVDTYASAPACTEGIAHWGQRAAQLQSQLKEEEPGISCHMNPHTRRIQCHTNSSCWGGGVYDHEINETAYTYNCAARCGASETMLEQCCSVCLNEKHGTGTNQKHIHCLGCDKYHYAAQAAAGTDRRLTSSSPCTFSNNGTFFCNRGDGCQAGQPQTANESWNCHIIPCNHCHDPHLMAECCKGCFEKKCAATQRTACVGCEFNGTGGTSYQVLSRDAGLPAAAPATATLPSVSAASDTTLGSASGPNIDTTVLLTVFTCIGICASLGILAFLAIKQTAHDSESSSEDEKLVPVAVTIMPPQANQGYAMQQTNWQQWEPASMQRGGGGMPTTMVGPGMPTQMVG
jgi:hypothetical protein